MSSSNKMSSSSDEEVKRLGYWLSAKKSKKLSLSDIEESLRVRKIEPVKIDLDHPIADQGPFHGILHKLTDFIAQAELGDHDALEIMSSFQDYASKYPDVVMLDPIDSLRTLINRFKTYCKISNSLSEVEGPVFVPKFVALESNNLEDNIKLLRNAGVTYPAVCKPIIAHGSTSAHQMTLVFNEKGLSEATLPCVVQSFVNHNAVLYKIFALGKRTFLVERPSIKNFYNSQECPPIQFDGGEISKANFSSQLTVQDENNSKNPQDIQSPCPKVLSRLSQHIQNTLGLELIGIDVVKEEMSGRLAVVDVNAFPGYDGVEDFSERLAEFVRCQLDQRPLDRHTVRPSGSSNANYAVDGNFTNGHLESTARVEELPASTRLISHSSITS